MDGRSIILAAAVTPLLWACGGGHPIRRHRRRYGCVRHRSTMARRTSAAAPTAS
jgi:hypothetical protein